MSNRRAALAALIMFCVAALHTPARAWSWGVNDQVRGSGEVISETRELGDFDGIRLSGDFQVMVRQGAEIRLEIKAHQNILPLIETRVVEGSKGRTLEIDSKKGVSFSSRTKPQITLVLPQLRMIAIAGSGGVRVEAMKTPAVNVSVSGSGDIEFVDLSSESLGVQVSGSGDIKVRGRTSKLNLSVAGSGDVHARDLQADEVKASIAGSGSATVHALKTLKISISGSGDIGYVGAPELSTSVAGNGSIHPLK